VGQGNYTSKVHVQEKIMPIGKLFGGNISLTAKSLDVRLERQGLIQSNIANMETPGYKVQELPFAEVMKNVSSGQSRLARTHPGHIAIAPGDAAASRRFSEEDRPVDLDEEMVKLSENQLMYQVAAKIIAKKFEGIQYVIDEGGR
jgi:flagellar basal-body rod protein FlgB